MYEENNPPDITIEEVRSTLEKIFPDREEIDIQFLYHGTYNVFLVEGEFIFRFSSTHFPHNEAKDLILNEVKTLEVLGDHLSIRIPRPEFIDVDSDTPMMGYRRIPGVSLSRCYDDTSIEQQKSLALQIVSFLGELHSESTKRVLRDNTEFTPVRYRKDWASFYVRVRDLVYPLIGTESVGMTETLFTEFLDNPDNFHFEPCVVHGDFDTSNILVDPETLKVTSVIDFEETRVYDPAADLLFFGEGGVFLKTLIGSYSRRLDAGIKNRMIFHFGRQPLTYVVYGLEHEITPMVNYGLDELSKRIANWDMYKSMLDTAFEP